MRRLSQYSVILSSALLMGAAPVDWASSYRTDLKDIHDTFLREHPGLAEPIDIGLQSRMEAAYKRAQLVQPTDYRGYAYALSSFISAIGDPHSFFYIDNERAPEGWPGFGVAKRGTDIVVVDRLNEAGLPPLDAKLVSCDGIDVRMLENESLIAFGDARNPAFQQWAATYILVEGDPAQRKPQSCNFAIDGKTATYRLRWRGFDGPSFPRLRTVAFGTAGDIGINEIAPQVYWINLPTFSQSEDTAPKLRAVVNALKEDRAKFRNSKAVIFDVRLNGGGFISWGNEILSALYGDEYLATHQLKERGTNDWRATPATLASLREVGADLRRIGADKTRIEDWDEVIAGVAKAMGEGEPFYRNGDPVPGPEGGLTRKRPGGVGPFPAKVIFLSDALCSSACLLFADRLLGLPGVIHVGAPTGGDGIYTQVREVATASGQGKYQLSQVVVRGRPRGDMEYYQPDIPYSGEGGEGAYRKWVLQLLDEGKFNGLK